ncbi:MAG: cell division protein ZapB [Deltaproteobacteria bacterium]|nr:cell division protein ZapB [Deltaproteobacteria bacterium]
METAETSSQQMGWGAANEDADQFQLLEEKIDKLIGTIRTLKAEKESLAEKVHIQEERLADLTREVEGLKAGRDKAKQRIVSLLEKIEQIEE